MKIYLPTEYLNKPCYIVNNGYIRVYETIRTNNQNVVYDIYINQDYMVKEGTSYFSSSTICDTVNVYTDDYFYRRDIVDILLFYVIMLGLSFYPIYFLLKTLCRRFRL